jgi:hypothetical protein
VVVFVWLATGGIRDGDGDGDGDRDGDKDTVAVPFTLTSLLASPFVPSVPTPRRRLFPNQRGNTKSHPTSCTHVHLSPFPVGLFMKRYATAHKHEESDWAAFRDSGEGRREEGCGGIVDGNGADTFRVNR